MQPELIEEFRLSPGDDRRIADLLARCFETDFGGRSYFVQPHHLRIVLRDGDSIIGHMALSLRMIRIGNSLTSVVGLAEVATDPARRGQGIAATLLRAAIAQARGTGAAFFLLFGDAGLYRGHGFHDAPNSLCYQPQERQRSGDVVHLAGKTGLMVLPLGERVWDADLPVDLLGFKF